MLANVTLSVVPNCKLFLAPNSVPAPVPPDATANGVDSVSIAVASVFVLGSYVKLASEPKGPLLLKTNSVLFPGALIPAAVMLVIAEPSPTKPPVAVIVPVVATVAPVIAPVTSSAILEANLSLPPLYSYKNVLSVPAFIIIPAPSALASVVLSFANTRSLYVIATVLEVIVVVVPKTSKLPLIVTSLLTNTLPATFKFFTSAMDTS